MTAITITDRPMAQVDRTEWAWTLVCPQDTLTVRELIRLRVEQEVVTYNLKPTQVFRGLVQPKPPRRATERRPINAAEQVARAWDAFEQNGFILLIDDRQVDSLEVQVTLRDGVSVTFLKLVPLVGG